MKKQIFFPKDLQELQQAYGANLGTKLYDASFRHKKKPFYYFKNEGSFVTIW